MMKIKWFSLAMIISLAACSADKPDQLAVKNEEPHLKEASNGLRSGVISENFDISVGPGDNFYEYVNGAWLKNTPMPADKSNYGAFTLLADQAQLDIRTLIEEVSAETTEPGSDSQKVGDYYKSFMAEEVINSKGAIPLAAPLAELNAVTSKDALLVMSALLSRIGVQNPQGVYINNDEQQPDQYITYMTQYGLGLPDRDWYLSTEDETHAKARNSYREYISNAMKLIGYPRADLAADSVLTIENRLAQAQWDKVKNRQAELTSNKMMVADLQAKSPQIDWRTYFDTLGIKQDQIIVAQPSFFEELGVLWEELSLEVWQDYYAFKLVDSFAGYLSQDFVDAKFAFEGKVLSGLDSIEPRWKRGVSAVEGAMGELVGRLYVQRHFQLEAKERMDTLISNLLAAFESGIDQLDWMSPETKAKAQAKRASFTPKIGYPDKWKDYSDLTVQPDDLVGNVIRSRRIEHDREVSKLGQPIDRTEWFMTPQTVNAYYNPTMNEIVFPAAILQPPFFNVAADDAVNYGGIGAVIGHEISHGFDDQGRKYDADGALRDWWQYSDAEAFQQRADKLGAQYDKIEVLPGKFINGQFTMGENIGDLSGLAVAYKAYKYSLNGEEAAVIDGFTGDQRFFIGWAQVWARIYRDENLEVRLTSDPHSPSEARTNAIVRNFDAWYEAFNIGSDAEMYLPPEQRVKIW
jgi:putative endopeptidase